MLGAFSSPIFFEKVFMARTFRSEKTRSRLLKLEDKRTGWQGEQCYAQEGKDFLKKFEHRHNRRVGKQQEREYNYD
jgi:hypothetical protein